MRLQVIHPDSGLMTDLGSGRQGRRPAGESPAVPIARFRHVAIPRFMLHMDSASRVAASTKSCREHRNFVRICALGLTYDYRTVLDTIPNTLFSNVLQLKTNVAPPHIRLHVACCGESMACGCRRQVDYKSSHCSNSISPRSVTAPTKN